ncbi:molybdate ABC transporter substrate-binding protein [Desulfovibrio sulfodismutans]|uniref:Molybdate ABC transporter substrate-binding protein n=1 Tax=Desulfolutivibrio sulfodismutans TaxID=63561 RepID=A0A7K3NRM2_9BACT|nr:molybdate ABC transporter substrate-binding protein [Desulfolutivibrio sulfodismutans]NDY58801.1 molybdate ABC transporter substrate-binding protein [Desulfolutivibrio sulfodismutans]QLA11547.1 molybdate ABC transporter substrate-binding protein [Desulfolutivibrio sulfodismutans DSM 3696]
MKRLILSLALVVALACPALAKDLTISAAASLTDAFTECKPLFEKANPGVTLTFNFAASGPLLKQIEQGAPVDVFASADQKTMDDAAGKNLIDAASRKNFAQNALVLAIPAGTSTVKNLASLSDAKVTKIGVGNPETVPVGRYTKGALEKLGVWNTLSPKCILAESVRQVLDYLSRGEVDAGFVYATDAKQGGDKVKVVEEIPLEKPVSYPMAVLAASKNKPEAAKFIAFVTSPEGAAVLAKYGFKKP